MTRARKKRLMISKELVRAWAKRTGLDRNKAAQHLRDLFATIFSRVMAGEEVRIAGYGKFVLKRADRLSNITGSRVCRLSVCFVPFSSEEAKPGATVRRMVGFSKKQGRV